MVAACQCGPDGPEFRQLTCEERNPCCLYRVKHRAVDAGRHGVKSFGLARWGRLVYAFLTCYVQNNPEEWPATKP